MRGVVSLLSRVSYDVSTDILTFTVSGKSSRYYTVSVKGNMNQRCSLISLLGGVEREWMKSLNSGGLRDLYLCLVKL